MKIENKTRWHPAFCASMELELMENTKGLIYDSEHNLGSEPLRIDLLVIKFDGMLFPMQIVVIKELKCSLHVWLKSLMRRMDKAQAENCWTAVMD